MKIIEHYGMPRRSGRYPWGSGKDPQRHIDLRGYIRELRDKGISDKDIAKGLNMSLKEMRHRESLIKNAQLADRIYEADILKKKGYSYTAIGEKLGINESSVRTLLEPGRLENAISIEKIGEMLIDQVESKKYIDVGLGVENHIGVSRTKLEAAIEYTKANGYNVLKLETPQQFSSGKNTTVLALVSEGTTLKDFYNNRDQLAMPTDWTEDDGKTFKTFQTPNSISSSRVKIRFSEEGGAQRDGLIELRPGVEDLSLGSKMYAQVRIGVDGTHYLKGIAKYGDEFPDGIDIIYNTSKSLGTPKEDVFKKMESDPENPFKSTVRQKTYTDIKGEEHLSAINVLSSGNKLSEEGRWSEWTKNLSSQFLSKQSPELAKRQLDLNLNLKKEEFDEIMTVSNYEVRKRLLESFADQADSAAVDLKAASLPRQQTSVIAPLLTIKDDEVYAPSFKNGEKVVLIRHPHGGIFEIPELTVNNKNKEGQKTITGKALDMIGISPKVALQLSGADFDGDTVLVIPNNKKEIKTSAPIQDLMTFEPKTKYKYHEGMTVMAEKNKGKYMGDISNLITDMTIQGAHEDEIVRAVRHSMVVIDAPKHKLDYKQSYQDHGIASLKEIYQGGKNSGASTLISRAKSEDRIDGVLVRTSIDPYTGKKVSVYEPSTYTNKRGKVLPRTTRTTKMARTDDAMTLVSGQNGTKIERIYAEYANGMKALANQARKEMVNTPSSKYSKSARETYRKEVEALESAYTLVKRNKPLERKAQLVAATRVRMKVADNPDLSKADIKKLKSRELEYARNKYRAKKPVINITPEQWNAIQAGALTNTSLRNILLNVDMKTVKQMALPKTNKGMSSTRIARAKLMISNGYTIADVANALGVSSDTLRKAIQ